MINFETLIIDNGYIYTQVEDDGLILKISTNNWKAEIIAYAPDAFLRSGVMYNDDLYFSDNKSKSISALSIVGKYHIECGQSQYFVNSGMLYPIVAHSGKLLLFSNTGNIYTVYDPTSKKIEKHTMKLGCEGNRTHHIYGDEIIICTHGTEKSDITICDLNTDQIMQTFNFPRGCDFKGEVLYDEKLYMLLKSGYVGEYDLKNYEMKYIENEDSTEHYNNISNIVVTDNKILYLPGAMAEDIFILDIERNEFSRFDEYPDGFSYEEENTNKSRYGEICEDGESILVAPRRASHLMEIKRKNGNVSWHKIELKKDALINASAIVKKGELLKEKTVSLNWYIKNIVLDNE